MKQFKTPIISGIGKTGILFGNYFKIVVFGILLWAGTLKAQDPIFSQFYANPIYLNPAFAGMKVCPNAVLNYRQQWTNIQGTYGTFSASYDQMLQRSKSGLGLIILTDNAGAGVLQTTMVEAVYAQHIQLNKVWSTSVGFQAGIIQKTLDWNRLNFGDQIDAKNGFIWSTKETNQGLVVREPDLSAGAMLYSRFAFFGISAHHLLQQDEAFIVKGKSPLPIRYTAHAGVNLSITPDTKISPNVIFQQQQDFTELNLGCYVTRGYVTGGLWYRGKDALIILLGFDTGLIKIGYSYDMTTSKLGANSTAGTHELSMGKKFTCKKVKPRFRPAICPSF